MITDGFIKLFRKSLYWGWYSNVYTKAVFLHFLLTANFADGEYRGVEIKRGQAVFSYDTLAQANGITTMQARTAVKNLKKTGDITVWTNRQFSVATVVNFDKYQQTDNKRLTNEQQTINKRLTNRQQTDNNIIRIEEDKKKRNKEKIYKREKQSVFSVDGASFDVDKYEGECSVE